MLYKGKIPKIAAKRHPFRNTRKDYSADLFL